MVNYVAVFACGVLSMVLGSLWYGPLFGKPWMRIMGFSKEGMSAEKKTLMMRAYGFMFLGSLVTAYVIAHSVILFVSTEIMSAATLAFWLWVGFSFPVSLGSVLWEGKCWKLLAINSGYNFVFIALSSIILTFWV